MKIDHLYPDFSTYFSIIRVVTNKGFPIWRDDGWLFFCESFLKQKSKYRVIQCNALWKY